MGKKTDKDVLPVPLVVPCRQEDSTELLGREWLVANKIGAYASSTVPGANTRRYHGLLVAAVRPPVGRMVVLSCLMDQLIIKEDGETERTFDLTTFEFPNAFSPDCRACLIEFRNDVAATFVYRCGGAQLMKEIILAEAANAVAVRYSLLRGSQARLRIWPFVALRDYHALRRGEKQHRMTYLHYHDGIRVEERSTAPASSSRPGELSPGRDAAPGPRSASASRRQAERPQNHHVSELGAAGSRAVHISVGSLAADAPARARIRRAQFHGNPQWWYQFRYRGDIARGQDGLEDLYTPGWFHADLTPQSPVRLTASLDDPKEVHFDATLQQKRRRLVRIAEAVGPDADETTRQIAVASDVFVVSRKRPNAHPGTTLVAGYHWFADWGRDAMIALPGLLLETGRDEAALQVLRTFADAMEGGMIPNRFDDYGGAPHFNSIDASLWFIVAADRYVTASGDEVAWRNELSGPAERILAAYHDGTRFDTRVDADGLLAGGSQETQLTWMDVKLGGRPVTPRYGKCVEINALWHAALRIAQRRCGDGHRGESYADQADRAAAAFAGTFWNEQAGCLYDYVADDHTRDASIRPNQILAVALPDCPLSPQRQRSVVEVVRRELLTPYGLRTLSPSEPGYRARYGGNWESRDRAYHQGTVWPWLMGFFVEAHLRVNDFSPAARTQAAEWLRPLDKHIIQAGIGFISEVFDGDPPHAPGGCIAQAWSVAEILRAKRLIAGSSETR